MPNWPFRRRVLSHLGNVYVRALTGIAVHDCTAGYRCWRRDALARLPLTTLASNGYAFQVEMTWHATRLGLRVAEVPIVFVERRDGQSKLSWKVVWESIVIPWRLGRT